MLQAQYFHDLLLRAQLEPGYLVHLENFCLQSHTTVTGNSEVDPCCFSDASLSGGSGSCTKMGGERELCSGESFSRGFWDVRSDEAGVLGF